MRLAGLQRLTLLDYPGEVACTVFTKGCNLRCPFCHNPELVLPEGFAGGDALADDAGLPDGGQGTSGDGDLLAEEEFFDYLDRRRGKLSGVVVSGGEPTLQKDLAGFLGRIRDQGFLVKLDTNGMNPEVLRKILGAGLADYVAMDVKNSPGKYAMTCGLFADLNPSGRSARDQAPASGGETASSAAGDAAWERAAESIAILRQSPVSCEFRTTVVTGLHTEEDILEIAAYLPADRPWYLQQFMDSGELVADRVRQSGKGQGEEPVFGTPSPADLERMRALASKVIPGVSLRGV